MATKRTVALVGGIVIVVSLAILIILTLTSPSRCMPKGEASQTERNWPQKTEPVSSPSTTLSPRTIFPPHLTNLPSLEDVFEKNPSPQPDTVLSTVNVVEEEETRQQRDDRTIAVTPPESSSTTISYGRTSNNSRQIIIVPNRKCGSKEKKDSSGSCRPVWRLGPLTGLTMPQNMSKTSSFQGSVDDTSQKE